MNVPLPYAAAGASLDRPLDDHDALATLRAVALICTGLAAAVQLMFHADVVDNTLTTLLAAATSVVGFMHVLRADRFRVAPASALLVLFYTLTAAAGALLAKTIEGTGVAHRLSDPVPTFTILFVSQVTLLLADRAYLQGRALQRMRHWLTRRIVARVGLLAWPSDLGLWLLGFLGIAATVIGGSDHESAASFGSGTIVFKLVRGFGFFKFAPFLILFRNGLSGAPSRVSPTVVPALAAYFAVLVGVSFITNSRSTFADAIPTVGICILVTLAYGLIPPSQLKPGRLLLIALVGGIAGLLLSRVALAMVVARDYRYFLDASALVHLTIEALFNSEWLEAARAKMDSTVNTADYSEVYVDNRFFSRFLMTKFHDNIVHYGELLGPDQLSEYRQFMLDRLYGTLPDPFLRALGINLNKEELVISNGDYLIYLADGWGLGGFKTGSMFGEMYTVWGWYFPIMLVLVAWLLFVVYDSLAAVTSTGRPVVAPLLLLVVWNLVGTTAAFGLGAETVVSPVAGVLRGLPQNIVLYLVAAWGVRAVFGRR